MKNNSLSFEIKTKADFFAHFLADKNVNAVFQLSGGMIAFLADSIERLGKSTLINNRHEQASGFAAEGYARVEGQAAVAMGTSGPGATNLITAIGSCFFDSVPALFVTGQVNQLELRLNPKQRQNGFQELDVVSIVKPIVKYAIRITSETDLQLELEKAWQIAHDGRPGPVLIDIPIDVQQERINFYTRAEAPISVTKSSDDVEKSVANLFELLKSSKRPLILAGGGIRTSKATDIFREMVKKLKIPVVQSLMGIDSLDFYSEFRAGMIGSYGNSWANDAISKSDLLICIGTRLDVRQTGTDQVDFVDGKVLFRIDLDPNELDGRIKTKFAWNVDLFEFITEVNKHGQNLDYSHLMTEIYETKIAKPQESEQYSGLQINPSLLLEAISKVFSNSNGYIVDVGQHQMWAAQSLQIGLNQRFITSGGMGAMGFALPAAIGAAVASTGHWIVIAGDGCTQLSIAEFQTLAAHNFPITLCVINNNQHGMVAQFQETNMEGRFIGTREGYSAPDFCSVASAFGIPGRKYSTISAFEEDYEFIASHSSGPLLLEFIVPNEAKALPKMGSKNLSSDL
jgi:acetolactate synthase-1/2/3 large subunit